MNDDVFDFAPVPDSRMMVRIAGLVAATASLGGAIEGLFLTLREPLMLSALDCALLVLTTAVVDGVAGFLIGLLGGAVAQFALPNVARWRRYRVGFGLGVFGLVMVIVAPLVYEMWVRQQRQPMALGTAAAGLCIVASVWFNAGYYFRREMIGAGPRLGWRVICAGLVVLLVVPATIWGGRPRKPSGSPLGATPNIVLVTVDTLRRDHVGTYGSVVNTPVLDKLAREGLVLEDAVTPVPETAPSHASMMTGMHPAIHGVVANGIPLRLPFLTAAEELDLDGYNTGAFVSSYALDNSAGLSQGFQVYDDDFVPILRGFSETRAARVLLPALMRFGNPANFPRLLERKAPDTIARALAWVDSRKDQPVFLWVHLFEPHSPYDTHDGTTPTVDHRAILAKEPGYSYSPDEEAELRALYRGEVEYVDGQIGTLLDGLKSRGVLDGALVVVIGDHGESLGEHDINFNHHGLYEEVLRVPAIVWTDKPTWTPGMRIARQVWVGDVANTLIEWAGLPLLSNTTSTPFLTHARGVVVPPHPLMLIGRMSASRKEGQLWGVRDPSGVKYILRTPANGGHADELYNLRDDPAELHDIAAEQATAVANGRRNVEAMLHGAVDGTPEADEMLKALGYLQ